MDGFTKFRVARYPECVRIDPHRSTFRYKPGAAERVGDLPLVTKVARESTAKINCCKDQLPDKPVAHREQVPEAICIPPAADAGAATVAARAPAQVAVRTFIVR